MDFLIRQLLKTLGVFIRSVKAALDRVLKSIRSWFTKVTDFSRTAGSAASNAVQSATKMGKTPSKREDYIAVGQLLIAKAFLVRALVILTILGLAIYYFAWPFILSYFLTARFWVEDKRVETWTGRAVVYADKKKTIPLYSGRLEEGKLQGEGKTYTDGVLDYEGTFLDGLRSGTGTAYEAGVLCYEGQFAQDVYEGKGTSYAGGETQYEGQFSGGQYHGKGTLYQEGSLLYDGQFDAGIYQGQGSLYQAGVLTYAGSFLNGAPQGMGTAYYYGGGVRYQGQFENGVPEGTGKAYEDGRLVYQGGFSRGLYSGSGTLYPAQGEQIEAEFQEGTPQGVVRWSKGGRLYYEGEWANDRPNGYGVLYAKSGDPAFKGTFSQGTIDGFSLLGLSADEVRKALGEENTKNTAGNDGTFSVSCARLGLTVQCTYQTDAAPAQVTAAYLYSPQDGEDWFRLLPGMDRAASPAGYARTVSYARQAGVPLAAGQYDGASAALPTGTETVLYQRRVPVLVYWTGGGAGTGGVSGGMGGVSGSATGPGGYAVSPTIQAGLDALAAGVTGMDTVEKLLSVMDSMNNVPASASASFGDEPVGGALAACADVDAASQMITALSEYWYQSEAEALLVENLARTNDLLEDAKQDAAMGQGSPGDVSALEAERRILEGQILDCEMEKKKAEAEARSASGVGSVLELTALDLANATVMFNPAGLDVTELPLVAAAYAQATGNLTPPATLEVLVKSALLNLQKSYEAAQAAIAQYEEAVQAADNAAKEYAMGTGTKADWYHALSSKNDVRLSLFSSMNAFTKQASDLNNMTGGWVSRSMNWHIEELDQVLETQFPEGVTPEELEYWAGTVFTDTGTTPVDAGAWSTGGGQGTADAGTASTGGGQGTADAGTASTGGGQGTSDAGTGSADAGQGTAGQAAPPASDGQGTTSADAGQTGGNTPSRPGGSPTGGLYPDWYDPTVEPVENEPGLPRLDSGQPSGGSAGGSTGDSAGGSAGASDSSAPGGTSGTSWVTADVSGWSESDFRNAMTPEQWDALWGPPEDTGRGDTGRGETGQP